LCRRRVVSLEEFTEEFDGGTAIRWAKHYKQTDLVKELRYFKSELKVTSSIPDFRVVLLEMKPLSLFVGSMFMVL
jgi:hypothetical protein